EEELASFDLYKLMMVYEKMMYQFTHRATPVKHTVVQFPYTIEQQKEAINELIALNKKLDFQELLKKSDNRVQAVFNFLAILEMLQQKLLDIEIRTGFNNFSISYREADSEEEERTLTSYLYLQKKHHRYHRQDGDKHDTLCSRFAHAATTKSYC